MGTITDRSPASSIGAATGDSRPRVLHWYDFVCPFCYVAQARNAVLVGRGVAVVELPFQAHPEIPPGGRAAGPRRGPMYEFLDQEARAAGLPLNWPPRLPDTRPALAAAEWVRRHEPGRFPALHRALFAAHFELGQDLGDPAVIDAHAVAAGADVGRMRAAVADGSAGAAVDASEAAGRRAGVGGTPAWLVGGQLISGLRPAADFERLADAMMP